MGEREGGRQVFWGVVVGGRICIGKKIHTYTCDDPTLSISYQFIPGHALLPDDARGTPDVHPGCVLVGNVHISGGYKDVDDAVAYEGERSRVLVIG